MVAGSHGHVGNSFVAVLCEFKGEAAASGGTEAAIALRSSGLSATHGRLRTDIT